MPVLLGFPNPDVAVIAEWTCSARTTAGFAGHLRLLARYSAKTTIACAIIEYTHVIDRQECLFHLFGFPQPDVAVIADLSGAFGAQQDEIEVTKRKQ